MRKLVVFLLPLVVAAVLTMRLSLPSAQSQTAGPQVARGVAFHDANGNRKFDEGEQPLPGVRVSNGSKIVATGDDGRYELNVGDDDALFVIKPRNWRTPLNEQQLPQFYYLHKPKGSPQLKFAGVEPTGPLPESIDFPFYPQREPDEFKAVMFGDPQPRTQQEVDYMAHDVVEELIGIDAAFGVTLGDIVFDDLSLFEPQARAIALIGIPWYNVIGNHDINLDAKHDRHSDETFERVFGPAYYSFDYGPVHFLVLDDIEWYVENGGRGRYRGGLGQKQMEFIKNDLALIPDDQLVVLMMHIPLVDVRDRHELYRLIEQRPFCMSISAHKHVHQHRYITREDGWQGPEPHHHVVNVTVCGNWWQGAPDERGIPHTLMADGAPNGYSIVRFDGQQYRVDFHAAGRSKDYQMQLHAPEEVAADKATETLVYANVFNGSDRWKVEIRVGADGEWTAMEKTREVDPAFLRAYTLDQSLEKNPWRDLGRPAASTHLWKAAMPADLPPGAHLVEVRAVDPHERTYRGYRIVRITAAEQPASEAAAP